MELIDVLKFILTEVGINTSKAMTPNIKMYVGLIDPIRFERLFSNYKNSNKNMFEYAMVAIDTDSDNEKFIIRIETFTKKSRQDYTGVYNVPYKHVCEMYYNLKNQRQIYYNGYGRIAYVPKYLAKR